MYIKLLIQRNLIDCLREILDGKPLEVKVKGLEIMNDDPTRVNVVYALVSSNKFVCLTFSL